MTIEPAYGWAVVAPGCGRPEIEAGSVRSRRVEAQDYIGAIFRRRDEPVRVGWRRAYRIGWRCIRVRISPAFVHLPHHQR